MFIIRTKEWMSQTHNRGEAVNIRNFFGWFIKLLPLPKEIQGQLLQSHQQDVETIVGAADVEGIK